MAILLLCFQCGNAVLNLGLVTAFYTHCHFYATHPRMNANRFVLNLLLLWNSHIMLLHKGFFYLLRKHLRTNSTTTKHKHNSVIIWNELQVR